MNHKIAHCNFKYVKLFHAQGQRTGSLPLQNTVLNRGAPLGTINFRERWLTQLSSNNDRPLSDNYWTAFQHILINVIDLESGL